MTQRSAAALEAQESFEVHKEKNIDLLHSKAVGLLGVLFLTVTGAAPMSAMLGNVPFAAGFGNGIYVPAAFLLATIVLTIFSVGFAAMAQKVSSVGGFYSYISLGLGRDMGMAAGMASFLSYSVFEASLCGLFAYFANAWVQTNLGVNVSWIWFAVFMIVLISILSYWDVKLSAKILGVALILEVIILVIFDAGAIMSGTSKFNVEALNVLNVNTPVAAQKVGDVDIAAGVAAVGIFMAFWSWVGFEMAPNYAEELRDPKRIIPRSLYYSVIGLGLFYIFTSWCAISSYPTEGDMLVKAVKDFGQFLPDADGAKRRPLGGRADEHSHPNELLCLRHGIPQHGSSLCLLARSRGCVPARPRQDAPRVQKPVHRLHGAVGAGAYLGWTLRLLPGN